MANWSLGWRAFYRYVGLAFAFTWWATRRRFLGPTVQGWLKLLAWGLLAAALLGRWGGLAIGITAVFLIWLYLSFWRAKRSGYSQFVTDDGAQGPPGDGAVLPPDTRQPLWATGVFSVQEFDKFVLLRRANYWRVPLGQQVVMVEHQREKYLYQFFSADSLRQVRRGWLIFGARPLPTLAVTFRSAWGDLTESTGERQETDKSVTIYLSFADEVTLTAVWRSIHPS
jgi:hypothetical protein